MSLFFFSEKLILLFVFKKILLFDWQNTVILPNFLLWKFSWNAQSNLDKSSETLRRLRIPTKFPHQEIRWNCGILYDACFSYNISHKFWDQSPSPHYQCCLQVYETVSLHKLWCCYSANMLQHWVGGRGLIYFCKMDYSRISINFSRNDLVSIIYMRYYRSRRVSGNFWNQSVICKITDHKNSSQRRIHNSQYHLRWRVLQQQVTVENCLLILDQEFFFVGWWKIWGYAI